MSDSPVLPNAPVRNRERLYSEIWLPEETRALRREVQALLDREVAPLAREIGTREESRESFPWAAFRAMAKGGLFGVAFPAPEGRGLRHPAAATVATIEEIAYHSNSLAGVFDGQAILVGQSLLRAPEELRRRLLGPLARGEIVGSFATTEPMASSDLRPEALQTVAERSGDEYVVNGRKRFITNSIVADGCVMLCRDGDRTTVLWVDLKAPGVRVGEPDKKLGNRGQITADIHLDHVRVPVANAIGGPGGGLKAALSILVYGRIGIAAAGVGMAQAAFDIAVEHMRRRQVFGKKLAELQHWQFRLAERATEIENARNLYLKAALRLDAGEAFPDPEAAMAKSYCAGVAVDMARDAVQVLGGYGFLRELAATGEVGRIEEIYRDSKIGEIYEGTTEIQKWLIARSIFGREITG